MVRRTTFTRLQQEDYVQARNLFYMLCGKADMLVYGVIRNGNLQCYEKLFYKMSKIREQLPTKYLKEKE